MKPKVWPYHAAAYKPFRPVYYTLDKENPTKCKKSG